MIKAVNTLKDRGVARTVGADGLDCAYSSLKRWDLRLRNGEPPARRPGPQKIDPLDFNAFKEDIDNLQHRNKRSHGTGALYDRYRDQVSRRDFNDAVATARADAKKERLENMQRIHWPFPGVAWSMDDTEHLGKDSFIHNIRDMGSKYSFTPLAGELPHGEEVAGHLDRLFQSHEAPLFLKRDNGPNLKHHAVDELLSKHMIIPLDSPGYYPQYNGSIEQAQGEVKAKVRELEKDECYQGNLQTYAALAAHELNHKPRRCLKKKNSCQVHFGPYRLNFNKKQRKETHSWIHNMHLAILEQMRQSKTNKEITEKMINAAWRQACVLWLQTNGLIIARKAKRCYPI